MIYKVEVFYDDTGKEIKKMTSITDEKVIKYTTPVPIFHPEMGVMEASHVMKVDSLEEAFEKIDEVREEYLQIMARQAERAKNQLVIAQNVPDTKGKLIV